MGDLAMLIYTEIEHVGFAAGWERDLESSRASRGNGQTQISQMLWQKQ